MLWEIISVYKTLKFTCLRLNPVRSPSHTSKPHTGMNFTDSWFSKPSCLRDTFVFRDVYIEVMGSSSTSLKGTLVVFLNPKYMLLSDCVHPI